MSASRSAGGGQAGRSPDSSEPNPGRARGRFRGSFGPFRISALCSALVLTGAYVNVLRSITDVVGATDTLMLVVGGALAAGTLVGRTLSARMAGVLGVGVALGGIAAYVRSIPEGVRLSLSAETVWQDVLALLTGLSVLRMVEAGMWAVSFVVAPAFLSWYFVVRRRYAAGSAVGMLALSVLILTGDAELVIALIGVLGAAATVGFGELDRRDATVGQVDVLAVALSLMVIVPLSVTAVPSGSGGGGSVAPSGESQALDGTLVGTDEQVPIVGRTNLSPEVRFMVETNQPMYWRTAAYDRYTGGTWVQSGEARAYNGSIEPPPGETETVIQTVEVETGFAAMPAAWRPVRVNSSATDGVRVTDQGGLRPAGSLSAGDRYTVVSEQPDPSTEQLRTAGTDYPEDIERRYTQLPESTPDRVGEYTASLTAEADTSYEQAQIIEDHLRSEWNYTLDVERPDGDIAAATLFDREAVYCTYFATTMAAMLRSQGVPARFVTGYTEGEQVGEDRYAVRGLNAHAWVEVYFPGVGWVAFDPTPPAREQVHEQRLNTTNGTNGSDAGGEADRENETDTEASDGADGSSASGGDSDTDSGTDGSVTDGGTETGGGERPAERSTAPDDPAAPASSNDGASGAESTDFGSDVPSGSALSRELLAVAGALVVGLVASAYRIGIASRLAATVRRCEPTNTPEATVERAYDRLERCLAGEYRERRTGESVRHYVDALVLAGADDRIERVATLYERSRYGPGVSESEAEEAVALVDDLTDEPGPPVLRRLKR